MNEFIQSLEKNEPERTYSIIEWSKIQYNNLSMLQNNQIFEKLQEIYHELNTAKPSEASEKLKFYFSILSLTLFVPSNYLPDFNLDTKDLDLFCTIGQIYLIQKKKIPETELLALFSDSLEQISASSSFYLLTPIYYYQHIPELIKQSTDSKSISTFFNKFFNITKKIQFNKLDFSSLEFLSKLFKQLILHLPNKKSHSYCEKISSFFDNIFEIQNIFSSNILYNFANSWYAFVQFCRENSLRINVDKQYSLVCNLIHETTKYKMHELFGYFPWKIFITFFFNVKNEKQAFYFLNLLLMAYRSIVHLENLKEMQEPSKKLINKAIAWYQSPTNKLPFYSIFSFFNSNLKQSILMIKHPYYYFISETENLKFPEYISFAEQTSTHSSLDQIDCFLHTLIYKKSILAENFKTESDEFYHKCEIMKARVSTSNYFLFPLINEAISSDCDIPLVLNVFKAYIRLLIYINRISLCTKQLENKKRKFSSKFLPISNDVVAFLSNMHQNLVPPFSFLMAEILFKATRKLQLTMQLIETLNSFPSSFIISLLKEMIQLAFIHIKLFFENDINDVRTICNFVLIIVRIHVANVMIDSDLLNLLTSFRKIILVTIFGNIKKISNQKLVFQMLTIFIKEMKLEPSLYKTTMHHLDEISSHALKDFIYPFLFFLPMKFDISKIHDFYDLLKFAFKNCDQDTIRIASQIFSSIFSQKDSLTSDTFELYQLWAKSDPSHEFKSSILSSPEYFTFQQLETFHEEISYASIYQNIYFSLCDNPEIIFSAFNILKFSIFNENLTFDEIYNLLLILQQLFAYNYIKNQLSALIPKVLDYHTNLFVNNISNTFFIACISVSSKYRSYISDEMRDLSMSFMSMVIEKNPDCQMIQTTAKQLLFIFPKHDRVHSIFSAISIYLRHAPQFIDLEMIRFLLIAMNDIFQYDSYYNQLLYKLLKTYTANLDQEGKQQFCEMIFKLNGNFPIFYRLVVFDILQELDCSLRDYSIKRSTQFPYLEMQQLMTSLFCHNPITPDIAEKIRQSGSGEKDRVSSAEVLSRRMSMYEAGLATDYNFNLIFSEKPFAMRLINFLSNSLVSKFKILRRKAQICFGAIFDKYIENPLFNAIHTQLRDPIDNKVFAMFGEQPERIAYYKRLIKIDPSFVTPSTVLRFLDSINQYLQMSMPDQNKFITNIKNIYSFLALKILIDNPDIHNSIIDYTIQNVDGLAFYIHSFITIRLNSNLSIYPAIRKYVLSFVSSFSTQTVQLMLSSAQATKFYIDLIDINENSTFLNIAFISHCSKLNPFALPIHVFDVIESMASIERCAKTPEFLQLIDSIFNAFIKDYDDKLKDYKYYTFFKIVSAMTKTFQYVENEERLLNLMEMLHKSLIISTISYNHLVIRVFEKTSEQFKLKVMTAFLQDPGILSPIILDNCLEHCIKNVSKLPKNLTGPLMKLSISRKSIFSISRLIAIEIPSKKHLNSINSILQEFLYDSDSYKIIHAMKLMCQLAKLDLLDSEIYWDYISQIFRIFKFISIPYIKYSYRLLQLMQTKFTVVPPGVVDSVLFSLHNKLGSIRDLQRVTDALIRCPPIQQILPYSPMLILTGYINFRLNSTSSTIVQIVEEVELALDVGLKYLLNCHVDKCESDKFMNSVYNSLLFMLQKNLSVAKIVDLLSSYLASTNEIPIPPLELFDLLLKTEFQLISFIILIILIKTQPETINENQELFGKCAKFIEKSDVHINPALLQLYFEFICRNQPLVHFADSLYQALLNDFEKFSALLKAFIVTNIKLDKCEEIWKIIVDKHCLDFLEIFEYNKEIQLSFAHYLINESIKVDNNPFLMTTMITMIKANYISDKAKALLVTNISQFINYLNASIIADNISEIEKVCDSTSNLVDILIETARCSSIVQRLKMIQKVMSFIPSDNYEKFKFLVTQLNIALWRNDALIYLLMLFVCDRPNLLAMLSFGSVIENQVVAIAITVMKPLFNKVTLQIFSDFLVAILSSTNSHQFDYILTVLNYIFFESDECINPSILINTAIRVNQPGFILNFLEHSKLFDLSYSNSLSDVYYSKFAPSFTISERSAACMTLLHNYEIADRLYSEFDWNSLGQEKIKNLNLFSQYNDKLLFNVHSSFDKIVHFIASTDYFNNEQIYSKFLEAIALLKRNEGKKSLSIFNQVDEILNSFFTPAMCPIAKEKYSLLKAFVQLGKQASCPEFEIDNLDLPLHSIQYEESLNPSFFQALLILNNKFKYIMTPDGFKFNHTEYDSSKQPILLLPNSFQEKFAEVCGITKHGLIGISEDQITKYMNDLSTKCEKNPNVDDVLRFAEICYELYLISPLIQCHHFAFVSFCYLLNSCSCPSFQRHEISARLLTLLSASNTDEEFEMIKSHKSIFEKKNLDVWRLWLGQLMELSDKKEIFPLISSLFIDIGYRALLYSKIRKKFDVENFLNIHLYNSVMPLEHFDVAIDAAFNCDLDENAEEAISLMNMSFPFIFAIEEIPISIYRISKPPKRLSDNLILLSLSTTLNCYTNVVLQRSTNQDGYPSNLKTLYNLSHLMIQIMKHSYITRSRNISLSSPFVFEIGKKYMLTVYTGELEYLPFIYEAGMANNESRPPVDTLLKYIVEKTTKYEFITNQHSMILSYASQAVFRHIMSTSYPRLDNFVLFLNPGAFPIVLLDFESNFFKYDLQESSFRYSPNIERLFGGNEGIALFELSMAATASSLVKHLETIRSAFELLIWDGVDLTTSGISMIIEQRNLIEEKLLQIAPTSGLSATLENCNEWISQLDGLIDNARNESLQPESAIPWF